MRESYLVPVMDEAVSGQRGVAATSEEPAAHLLLARLFPHADAELLARALADEVRGGTGPRAGIPDSALAPPERALAEVRAQLARAELARDFPHAMNNPLAALLAEAQLLQLDTLSEEQRVAVQRIVEITRRMVGLTRRLEG